ncbi:MAG: Ni/Fe-hydrogenase, b-type cytochrome subunit [Nitrospirota bacterium]
MNGRSRVYVWEFPVRFTHWVNVLSILTLSVTGYYIGNPFVHAQYASQYIMGWMRFIHFVTAYVFTASIVVRLYWAFVGNKYSRWTQLFPLTPARWHELLENLKFYLFIRRKPVPTVGHTALAGAWYFFLFVLPAYEIVSGFALYSVSHTGSIVWTALGGWLLAVLDLQTIRLWHHLVMYFILAFVLIHIYIALYLDIAEKNGLMESIFSGYKFVTREETK